MTSTKDQFDKYEDYKVDFHALENHSEDEFDSEHDGKISDWHNRHRDQVLEKICDTHPSSPMCKVFDD